MRIDAEKDMVPDPKRIVPEFLHPYPEFDQLLGVGKFGEALKIPHRDPERI